MTRKDYELIAAAVRETFGPTTRREDLFDDGWESALEQLSRLLAARLQKDNPRFDTQRFLDACRQKIGSTGRE